MAKRTGEASRMRARYSRHWWKELEKGTMRNSLASTMAVFFLAAAGMAQDGLIIPASVKPQARRNAEKIYLAACAAVEREFAATRPLNPRAVLVLGGKKDGVVLEQGRSGCGSGIPICLFKVSLFWRTGSLCHSM